MHGRRLGVFGVERHPDLVIAKRSPQEVLQFAQFGLVQLRPPRPANLAIRLCHEMHLNRKIVRDGGRQGGDEKNARSGSSGRCHWA